MPTSLVIEPNNETPIVPSRESFATAGTPGSAARSGCIKRGGASGRCEPVVRCGLTPDLDARSVEIPLWMFDAAACGVMPTATAPVVTADALRELRISIGGAPTTPSPAFRSKLSTSNCSLLEVLMSSTAKPSHPATQLTLFQPPRSGLSWEATPLEHRQQVERLLARMLREHALRQREGVPAREARDE